MGHFDILLLQTLQNLVETALEAGAGDRFAGPGPLPGAPRQPLHLLLVDTLGEGLHHGLQLVEGGGPALPHLLHGHAPEPEVQAAQVGGLGRLLVAPGAGGAILSRDSETSNFLTLSLVSWLKTQMSQPFIHKYGKENTKTSKNVIKKRKLLLTVVLKHPVCIHSYIS